MVEGLSKKQGGDAVSWKGRDPAGRIVNFEADQQDGLVGMMIPVRVTEAKKHSLLGERNGASW